MSTENVPGSTADQQEELLSQLRDLIPEAFQDGELDADSLLTALGAGDERKPSFTFSWPGIEEARQEARAATTARLMPDPEASLNWENARDALVEGDNLQVLKLLKRGYSGQAKLIYIDPPYNTGNSFTYNDDFAIPESDYLAATGQIDEQGNATTSKIENTGRKHAPWLSMMFPRLAVARHLLRRDGVILASIDNNEVHHFRLLLDAVFGAENFVDMMTWRGARKGDGKLTAGGQDYILVYARDLEYLKTKDTRWKERKSGLEPVYAKLAEFRAEHGNDHDAVTACLKKWYKSLPDEDPSKAHAHYKVVDDRGIYFPGDISSPNPRPNLMYDWKGYSVPANGWRYERAAMERLDADNRLLYPDTTDKRIQVKRYLEEHEDWSPASVFYRDRRAASKALKKLMDVDVFDNPKNVDVLARLIHSMTDDGDLVIDFFAGSGSTGQAVWEQNPKDSKTRHWVLVQIPAKPDATETTGKNALNAGYETIFEVTAERLRRAAAMLQGDTLDAPDLGFRVFRTRPTNLVIQPQLIASLGMTGDEYLQMSLSGTHGSPVVTDADPLAVAWEVALKSTATKLDAKVTEHELNGVTVYEFTQAVASSDTPGRLLISLDEFDLATADVIKLTDNDTLILRGDKVSDATTLTLAPRLQSKLVLLERVPREVSL
ncbi:site-specific DNA-methyltransferase [Arthrobacter roseus]|uniref:site-specific DNA-methyltransferase n=1 Tax=Arthrobacter roseus TaxID=136274 RepID=UPI0019648231|nr:site-specific DNA-methyltransferase [Arthrobacter roseus]MBM7849592.1 adenine-specific DNA-methyltransferase [Arthrobacter roseus]